MKVFIGYDPREDMAYQVCKHSILKHQPNADVRPLVQKELRQAGWYKRPEDKLASTEFTFTRFLIPELTNFRGWAVFMDCDMILTTDIAELFAQADDKYAVMCVQHDYTPKEGLKMDGCKQLPYPRKNWSSVSVSSDGSIVNAVVNGEYRYNSIDYGTTWTSNNSTNYIDNIQHYLGFF